MVHAGSTIHSFAELRGKRFCVYRPEFDNRLRASGPVYAPERPRHSTSLLLEVIFTGNHDSALLAVYARHCRRAALSTTRLDPQNLKLESLRIIWKSETLPLGPFVARKDLGNVMIDQLRQAISPARFIARNKTAPETVRALTASSLPANAIIACEKPGKISRGMIPEE